MSARKGKNLNQVKYQLKSLEEAFERDATAIRSGIQDEVIGNIFDNPELLESEE